MLSPLLEALLDALAEAARDLPAAIRKQVVQRAAARLLPDAEATDADTQAIVAAADADNARWPQGGAVPAAAPARKRIVTPLDPRMPAPPRPPAPDPSANGAQPAKKKGPQG